MTTVRLISGSLLEMDLEEENEAGETAARGRLEGTVPQRAAISEMDPHMVHEALMGDSARETIISMYGLYSSFYKLHAVPPDLHAQSRGRHGRHVGLVGEWRVGVHGGDPIDVCTQRTELRGVLQRSSNVRRVHQPNHRVSHRPSRCGSSHS